MTSGEAIDMRKLLLDLRQGLIDDGAVDVRVEVDEPPADEDEAPYREMGQTIASARNRERAERLARIDDALVRLGEDPENYGLCEACDEPIAARRLVLLPFTRLCVECQTSQETRGPIGRRKVTDYR